MKKIKDPYKNARKSVFFEISYGVKNPYLYG